MMTHSIETKIQTGSHRERNVRTHSDTFTHKQWGAVFSYTHCRTPHPLMKEKLTGTERRMSKGAGQ